MNKTAKPAFVRDKAPEALSRSVEKAKARTADRRHGPPLALKRDDEGKIVLEDGKPVWDWPFAESADGSPDWAWLVLDAFGTRYTVVASVFVNHLLDLCRSDWDDENQIWVPDDAELSAILHIVAAQKPQNEAQAALAAQTAATHILTMKVAKRVADYPHDTRMINAYAKLARASAAQFETMAILKGKRRSTRQQITVSHEKHIHHHQHVHLEGGVDETGVQPHAREGNFVGPVLNGTTLPGKDQIGEVVPIRRSEGQARLSHARRAQPRSSEG